LFAVRLFSERNAEKVEDVLKRADTALYAAKNDGRNTVRFYRADVQVAVNFRLTIEENIALAIRRDELELQFQPRFGDADGRLAGVRARSS
jgi:predicted signal transduction protein with EAL and GGDEF domain